MTKHLFCFSTSCLAVTAALLGGLTTAPFFYAALRPAGGAPLMLPALMMHIFKAEERQPKSVTFG